MKNRIPAVVVIILGLLAAIGPRTIFPVCPVGDMKMRCYSTASAELATGLIGAAVGIALLLTGRKKIRIILSVFEFIIGLIIVLIPTVIVGVCGNAMMHCVSVTKPALIVTGIFDALVSLVLILLTLRDISIEKKTR